MNNIPTQVDLVEQLYNENEKLREHIKQLEDVGDSLFRGLTRDEAIRRWLEVKGEKP